MTLVASTFHWVAGRIPSRSVRNCPRVRGFRDVPTGERRGQQWHRHEILTRNDLRQRVLTFQGDELANQHFDQRGFVNRQCFGVEGEI